MIKKGYILLFLTLTIILFSVNSSYCQTTEEQKELLFSKILNLAVLKNATHQVDSLKKAGFKIDISFDIAWEMPIDIEPRSEIAWIHINQTLLGTIDETLYLIKYDKLKEEFISIEQLKKVGIKQRQR